MLGKYIERLSLANYLTYPLVALTVFITVLHSHKLPLLPVSTSQTKGMKGIR